MFEVFNTSACQTVLNASGQLLASLGMSAGKGIEQSVELWEALLIIVATGVLASILAAGFTYLRKTIYNDKLVMLVKQDVPETHILRRLVVMRPSSKTIQRAGPVCLMLLEDDGNHKQGLLSKTRDLIKLADLPAAGMYYLNISIDTGHRLAYQTKNEKQEKRNPLDTDVLED
ncbi:hypothetical protein C0Q70_03651 [Pomacea canaliculata]|uniref:Uncharacterized protein n=1 Tax=Pomacea canaliculata TaxID=400727 RepID=A0A2T7PTB8_POMCA|nr:hypothetical protein C0Q70_03651 [Pomacea canaliculata]